MYVLRAICYVYYVHIYFCHVLQYVMCMRTMYYMRMCIDGHRGTDEGL